LPAASQRHAASAAEIAVGAGGHPGGEGMEIDERRSAAELFQEGFLPVLLGG